MNRWVNEKNLMFLEFCVVKLLFKVISILKPTRCTNVSNLFCFGMALHMLHVSDGLSVHHQEFKTVHTAVSV